MSEFQPSLFGESRFERWLKFHEQNPHIYELFLDFTLKAKQAGREYFGARIIWERIRWYLAVETKTEDGLKLNDHYPAYYSRLVMLRNPELAGFFERRDARFDATDEQILKMASEVEAARQ